MARSQSSEPVRMGTIRKVSPAPAKRVSFGGRTSSGGRARAAANVDTSGVQGYGRSAGASSIFGQESTSPGGIPGGGGSTGGGGTVPPPPAPGPSTSPPPAITPEPPITGGVKPGAGSKDTGGIPGTPGNPKPGSVIPPPPKPKPTPTPPPKPGYAPNGQPLEKNGHSAAYNLARGLHSNGDPITPKTGPKAAPAPKPAVKPVAKPTQTARPVAGTRL